MAKEEGDNKGNEGEGKTGAAGDNKDAGNAGEQDIKAVQDANKVILDNITAKQKEMEETEARIDKKTKALEGIIEEAKMSGKAYAGKTTEEAEEEKKNQDAMKLIEGTGLETRAGFKDSKTQA